jgi:hypothetical protein
MDRTLWLALLALGAAGLLLRRLDARRLRRAAARIDAGFKVLALEPQWTPLTVVDDLPATVIERLDRFDASVAGLGFAPLGRLREGYPQQNRTVGVRTVLVDAARGTTAVYACAHDLPETIAFRSLASRLGETLVLSTDARKMTPDPANQRVTRYATDTAIDLMHREHLARLAAAGAAPRRFETLDDYRELQVQMWREGNAARREQRYVIDLDVLRGLATPHLSEDRLKRLHAEIVRLNARTRRSIRGAGCARACGARADTSDTPSTQIHTVFMVGGMGQSGGVRRPGGLRRDTLSTMAGKSAV